MIPRAYDDHGAPWRSPLGGPRIADDVDRWPESEIVDELEKRREAEAVAGPERGARQAIADGGNAHGQDILRAIDEGSEPEQLQPGDHVSANGAEGVVVRDTGQDAGGYVVKGQMTVAEYSDVDPAEDVYEVVFPGGEGPSLEGLKRYGYARSDLELVRRVGGGE